MNLSHIETVVENLAKTGYDSDGRILPEFNDTSGVHRAVCLDTIGDIAYKFAIRKSARQNNWREWNSYHCFPRAVQRKIATPHYISDCGSVLALELVPYTLAEAVDKEIITNERKYALRGEFETEIRTLLDEAQYEPNEVHSFMYDNHFNNLGMRANGEVVWLDWAPGN